MSTYCKAYFKGAEAVGSSCTMDPSSRGLKSFNFKSCNSHWSKCVT